MKIRFLAAVFGLLWPALALAQSSPGWTYGQVPTPGMWNAAFAAKQDALGYTAVNRAGDTMSGPLRTFAPTGTGAGLVIVPGLVPTAPADGSIWTTNSGLFARINGATVGPLGPGTIGGPGATTVGHIATWGNSTGTSLLDGGLGLPSSAIVGISDTQTLTNKSISASQVNSGTLAAARMPALTGDVTSSAGSAATTIAAGAVTSAKMAIGAAVANIGFTPLNPANNLSEVASAPTAWTNLGGGSIGKLSTVSLTANVSGTLPIANGGTGQSSLFGGAVLLGNGTSPIAGVALSSGQLLVGQSGYPTAQTMGGDCTLSNSAAITCTKTAGTALGTAATKNVGAAAGNVVQLDGSARLPSVDGSQLTNLPGVLSVPVRQTVLSGPASSGLPTFLPATTGTLSVTSQNVSSGANALVATAANGFGTNGAINVVGVATSNLTWSSLTASTTNYLFVTVTSGTLTAGSTTLQPIYQRGGTISTTAGQYTFDIIGMQMYLGNGTVANPVNVVFVGEAVTSGSAVTSTIAYAYQGQWIYTDTSNLPGPATTIVKNHNIGVDGNVVAKLRVICLVSQYNYSVGDIVDDPITWTNSAPAHFAPITRRNTVQFSTGGTYTGWHLMDQSSGTLSTSGLTPASWRYQLIVQRGW